MQRAINMDTPGKEKMSMKCLDMSIEHEKKV